MKLDVRTKLAVLLCVSVGTFVAASIFYEAFAMILIALLQLASGRSTNGKRVISYGILGVYAFLLVMQFFILPELPHSASVSLSIPVVQLRKAFPIAMVVVWIARTTSVAEIIATLTKLHIPKSVTVTFAVTLRYFPTIAEEWTAVREAMKLRRIQIMRGNPFSRAFKKVACHVLPMVAAASRTSDELAASASCRGIDNPAKATCLAYHPMKKLDWVIVGCALVVSCSSILVRVGT